MSMDGITYKLKPMVAARLLAELTTLCLLVLVPVYLLLHGDFNRLDISTKIVAFLAAVISLVVIPAYGFVTYKVNVDEEGLSTVSLFKKQFARWPEIKSLTLKTSWGWRRYIAKLEDGDLSFPIWLNNLPQLCSTIRGKINKPLGGDSGSGGGAAAAPREYKMAPSAVLLQIARMAGSLFFIALLWIFFANMHSHGARHVDSGDRMIILIACLIFTLFLVSRVFFLLIEPKKVITDAKGLQLATWFYDRTYEWSQFKKIAPATFLLPDGLLVTTQWGMFLIGDQLDAFDELQEELVKRVPPAAVA